jgi:hypothetical protein
VPVIILFATLIIAIDLLLHHLQGHSVLPLIFSVATISWMPLLSMRNTIRKREAGLSLRS